MNETILILDYDTNNINQLKTTLTSAGFAVHHLEEGKEPVELAKQIKADLIISTVDLGSIDGSQLFHKLRSLPNYATTPFVFISDEKKVDDRIKFIEVGVDDYITKPFHDDEIVARIKNLLSEITEHNDIQIETKKGFSGNLTEMNLVDLIQTLELGKKSAIIKLKHHTSVGTVYIAKGEVADASLDGLPPEKAIMRMFTWTIGTFYVNIVPVNSERKIAKNNKQLLEIGIRRVNEWDQLKQGIPPLNAMIVKSNTNNYDQLSQEEIGLLKNLKHKSTLSEIIEKSNYDDLKALEIVRSLHQKGYLQETEDNYSHYVNNYLEKIKRNSSTFQSPSEKAVSILSNLFKKSANENQLVERRKAERRQIPDRRQHGRRRYDRLQQSNPVYLTKAELLMLKQALKE